MMILIFYDTINQIGNAMKLDNATVLVTGANGGLGREFVRAGHGGATAAIDG